MRTTLCLLAALGLARVCAAAGADVAPIEAPVPAMAAAAAADAGLPAAPAATAATFRVNEDVPAVLAAAEQAIAAARAATNDAAAAVKSAVVDGDVVAAEMEAAAKKVGVAVARTPDVTAPVSDGGAAALDGLEVGRDWICEAWGDSGKVELVGDKLHVTYAIGANRKVAFTKVLARKLRVGPEDTISMDVNNPTPSAFRLSLGLFVGFTYFETPARAIEPGRAGVSFDMGAATFKSEETHWLHQDSLKRPINVDKLTLLIYARKEGEATFDNIRVHKTKGG